MPLVAMDCSRYNRKRTRRPREERECTPAEDGTFPALLAYIECTNPAVCRKELKDFMNAKKIALIVGIIVFIVGFWLIFTTAIATQSVPIGIMIAGLWSIIYGYIRGWDSIDDRLKFFVGLIVAALVIGGSVWLIQRYQKKTIA